MNIFPASSRKYVTKPVLLASWLEVCTHCDPFTLCCHSHLPRQYSTYPPQMLRVVHMLVGRTTNHHLSDTLWLSPIRLSYTARYLALIAHIMTHNHRATRCISP